MLVIPTGMYLERRWLCVIAKQYKRYEDYFLTLSNCLKLLAQVFNLSSDSYILLVDTIEMSLLARQQANGIP